MRFPLVSHSPFDRAAHPFRRGVWNAPKAVTALPLELLRSQNYPGNPGQIEQGMERYAQVLAGTMPEPVYFPMRSTFQGHKEAPGSRWAGATAEGAMTAMHPSYGPVAVVRGIAQLPVPTSPMRHRAREMGLVKLPVIDPTDDTTGRYVILKQMPWHDRVNYPQAAEEVGALAMANHLQRQLLADQSQFARLQQHIALIAGFHNIANAGVGRR